MAQTDVRMPSADEDFDAVLETTTRRRRRSPNKPRAAATSPAVSAPAPVQSAPRPVSVAQPSPISSPKPVSRPVQVIDHDEPAQPADTTHQSSQQRSASAYQAATQAAYNPTDELADLDDLSDDELFSPAETAKPAHRQPEYVEPLDQNTVADQSDSTDPAAELLAADTPTYDEPDQSNAPGKPSKPVKPAKAPKPPKPPRQPRAPGSKPIGHILLELVLVIGLICLGLYTWTLYTDRTNLNAQVSKLSANPQLAIQKQTDDLIKNVGGLITLPSGETPTVASVSDAAQAKQQSAFFNNAQNGDKVLMYVKAGEAILYRPTTDKIILVAPLTFNNNASGTAAATTPATTSTTTPATTPKATTTKP